MWPVVLVALLLAGITAESQFINDSLINLEKILFWQKSQFQLSPQFTLGVSIGLKLLKGAVSRIPDVNNLLREMQSIEDEFHRRDRNNDKGNKLNIYLIEPSH